VFGPTLQRSRIYCHCPHERAHAFDQTVPLVFPHSPQRPFDTPDIEHLLAAREHRPRFARQPHECAASIPFVAHPLEQPFLLQPRDDPTDDRLGAPEVRRHLSDRQRPARGEVKKDRVHLRRHVDVGSRAALAKTQVDRGEELAHLLRRIAHEAVVRPAQSIVNPDGLVRLFSACIPKRHCAKAKTFWISEAESRTFRSVVLFERRDTMSKYGQAFSDEGNRVATIVQEWLPGEWGGPGPRAERMNRVWQKHLRGELVTLDEFLARRRTR
jgi:hypothetical protein